MSGGTVLARHKQFIKERQYVNNVSLATIRWYEQSLELRRRLFLWQRRSETKTGLICRLFTSGFLCWEKPDNEKTKMPT
jgi:hypothetical protein